MNGRFDLCSYDTIKVIAILAYRVKNRASMEIERVSSSIVWVRYGLAKDTNRMELFSRRTESFKMN